MQLLNHGFRDVAFIGAFDFCSYFSLSFKKEIDDNFHMEMWKLSFKFPR